MARPTLSIDDKAARRQTIIDAAHRLFRERHRLPTVGEIALLAGIAKGSVYLSFDTKEEIFIALLTKDFNALLLGLIPVLQELPPDPGAAAVFFAEKYASVLTQLPELLPMAAMTNAVLEKNLPLAAMTQFKTDLVNGLLLAGAMLEQRATHLQPGQGAQLLMRTWALTLGLWQALDYPPAMKEVVKLPEFAVLNRSMDGELGDAVRQLWRGALS